MSVPSSVGRAALHSPGNWGWKSGIASPSPSSLAQSLPLGKILNQRSSHPFTPQPALARGKFLPLEYACNLPSLQNIFYLWNFTNNFTIHVT